MTLGELAGLLLAASTVIVYVGFSLFPSRIYTAADKEFKVKLVKTYPSRWTLSQTTVIVGSTLTLAGLILVTLWLQRTSGSRLAWAGLIAVLTGGLLWDWHLVTRITRPHRFARGELAFAPFLAYSVLTPLGLAAYGAAFYLEGDAPLLGLGVLVAALIVLGLEYLLKDMPPFVHYALTLAIGLVLFL